MIGGRPLVFGGTMTRSACYSLLALVISSIFFCPVYGQEDDDEDEPFLPGLIANYETTAGGIFARQDRVPQVLGGETVPDWRLANERWTVEWTGRLRSQEPGEYRLSAFMAGRVEIRLAGEVILTGESPESRWMIARPVPLEFGEHPIQIRFEASSDSPRFSLYWQGPKFQLEPISDRQFVHDRAKHLPGEKEIGSDDMTRGRQLVRSLRCGACHVDLAGDHSLPAPDLQRAGDQLRKEWLTNWLSDSRELQVIAHRRMPHFGFSADETAAVAAFFTSLAAVAPQPASALSEKNGRGDSKKGRQLMLSLGCLACHQVGELGTGDLFGGGDLTSIALKRPVDFFSHWLATPQTLNRSARMPQFDLSPVELRDLSAHLASLTGPVEKKAATNPVPQRDVANEAQRGKELVIARNCVACHSIPGIEPPEKLKVGIRPMPRWEQSCLAEAPSKRQPVYRLSEHDAAAVRTFVSAVAIATPEKKRAAAKLDAQIFLQERNCLACHARDGAVGLAAKLTAVAASEPELAQHISALTPPPLTSVGDKLHDEALLAALRRTEPTRRPWLNVRMPKFTWTDFELQTLTDFLLASDRLPSGGPAELPTSTVDRETLAIAGRRLVTPDGFGCTSCHQIGKVMPSKAPLNARGADLSLVGKRIRREWFDRWVRNPARIVPGMEMPSVQIPVRGLLQEKLPDQLAAVWEVLNVPGFEPPDAAPTQTLRLAGEKNRAERVQIVTDVLRSQDHTWIKPLLIGLPNRHNGLFDCETARLVEWSVGDVARQRTKGKEWFWEPAGTTILSALNNDYEFSLRRPGDDLRPALRGQFPTELDGWKHIHDGLEFQHRLHFQTERNGILTLRVTQTFSAIWPTDSNSQTGFRRTLSVHDVPADEVLLLHVKPNNEPTPWSLVADGRAWVSNDSATSSRVQLVSADAKFSPSGHVQFASVATDATQRTLVLEYLSQANVKAPDALEQGPSISSEVAKLQVAPGFEVTRLPLPVEQMPTALAWRPNGDLIVASLKGRVWLARDTNGDGLEDSLLPFSDELAAPFGVAASGAAIDVATKFALVRLFDDDDDGRADRTESIASGWGHTADYHDWTIGLPRDSAGNYLLGLPCQQDKRSAAAAQLRGTVVKLLPRTPTRDNPQRFEIQVISRGHRFPMGLALDRFGELFVTDNQGNYNPFNELNHVRPGAHFGFINAVEKTGSKNEPSNTSPLTPPAIELPHPWTRSVNGICFLESPLASTTATKTASFGPFMGHLVGCEYDTRRLVRMSLQRVGDVYQGAAYPLTLEPSANSLPLLGPLVCAVSPRGDLYVGGIRDSGWGAGNNIGEIVRFRPRTAELPAGIAEIRAVPDGFHIQFTQSVSPSLATEATNYSISSFRRVATPAYGGADVDRRTERISKVTLSPDNRSVTVTLPELREGFVYEFHLHNLTPNNQLFFPAEAFFTLRKRITDS